MKTKYSKKEFDKVFPRGMKQSKENLRRVVANLVLSKGYSMEETYGLVNKQLP